MVQPFCHLVLEDRVHTTCMDLLRIGPGRLCLKHHLLFYSFIPQNEPIILFKLPIIPILFPVIVFHRCRIGHRIVKL